MARPCCVRPRLADHCVAAAARRGLAGHLPCAALLLRNKVVSSTSTMAAAGWCWCLFIMNSSVVVYLAQSGSLDVLELVGKVGCAGWRGLQRHPAAQRRVACVDSGVGRLVRHVVNGLLEIFLAVCGSSAPAPSCWVERRRQTSWAAARAKSRTQNHLGILSCERDVVGRARSRCQPRVCELAGLELAFAAFTVDTARLRLLVVSS